MENESARAVACAQIDRGSLEREVVAYLSNIPGGTATRNQERYNCYYPDFHKEFILIKQP